MPSIITLPIAIAAISLLSLSSCSRDSASIDPNQQPPGAANDQPGIITAEFSEIVEHDGGTFTYNGKLFSGRAVEHAPDGTRLREDYFWEGYRHGSSREFYADGSNKSDVRYEKGVANGVGFEWDEEGGRIEILYEQGVELKRGKLLDASDAP